MFTKPFYKLAALLLCLLPLVSHAQSQALTLNPSTGDLIWPNPSTESAKLDEFRRDAGIMPHKLASFDATGGNVTLTSGATHFYSTGSQASISVTRTLTIPAASAYKAGTVVTIADSGITLDGGPGALDYALSGADTWQGATPIVPGPISTLGGWIEIQSDGVSSWRFVRGSPDTYVLSLGYLLKNASLEDASLVNAVTTGDSSLDITGAISTTGAGTFGGGANAVQMVVRGHASQNVALQQWKNSAGTVLATVDYLGGGNFVTASIADSGNALMGGISWILRTGIANTLKVEGGQGDYLIDVLNLYGEGTIEIEGATADAHETFVSFQDPTGNDTYYRFAKSATTTTGDVVSVITKGSTGDPTGGYEGQMCINTTDTNLKIYAGGAWRTIADW